VSGPRRVVVTAGGSGIGRAMAEAFLTAGDRVAICDRDAAALAEVHEAHPGTMAEQADVTDEAALAAFCNRVEAEWGGADVVCANAGTGGPAGRIETLGLQDWRDCLAVNLDGAFLTCRWAARVMRAQGGGVILITSSVSGLFGFPQRSPYVTAKWGLVGLTKALASELGPAGVRVNAICPGAVEGPRMDRVVAMEAEARGVSEDAVRDGFAEGTALRRFVRAEEVATTALFLASDAASAITGQALAVDGHTERVT
jgi:NAD(P)-dependent dehydrogenase (short-subunit alcohol dehydrogenase family)